MESNVALLISRCPKKPDFGRERQAHQPGRS
jgi:hypothetical protein